MTVKSAAGLLTLHAETAADLMTSDPVSLRHDASLQEALILFTERGFTAAPVIDDGGRAIGVLSQSDIIVHDRQHVRYESPVPEYYRSSVLRTSENSLPSGFQVEVVDQTLVEDMMTPCVFAVRSDASSAEVIHQMSALKVHRLFVLDENGVLVGVISALDVLRALKPSGQKAV